MRIRLHTDYALRVLIHLAAHPDERATAGSIARDFGISRHHLLKVCGHLQTHGWIESTRGKGGGLKLARDPAQIAVGQVVRDLEQDFELVECFEPGNTCVITRACELKRMLGEALRAFFAVLDRYTLADLMGQRRAGLRAALLLRRV